MTSPFTIRDDLAKAKEEELEKLNRLMYLRTKAESAGAIRYDKDRVQSSNAYDLADMIIGIDKAENAWRKARANRKELIDIFCQYLTEAGFDKRQRSIWLNRYAIGLSIGETAKAMDMSKSLVQYHLSDRAESKYLRCHSISA